MTIEFDGQNNKITRDTAGSIKVDRKTSEGDIVEFQKDGSTVGSIGSAFSSAYYTGSNSGMRFGNNGFPTNGSGANNDNAVDLGISSVRWKDFYLAGNIYLGGTGSANALDDYEEGTWTPVYVGTTTDPVVTYPSLRFGIYTKIGRMVYIQGQIAIASLTSAGTGDMRIGGLPFTVKSGQNASITVGSNNDWGSNNHPSHILAVGNTTELSLRKFPADPQDELVNVTASGMLSGGNDNLVNFAGFYEVN